MKYEFVCAGVETVPAPIISVVIQIVLRRIVISRLGVVIKPRRWLKASLLSLTRCRDLTSHLVDKPGLLKAIDSSLSLNLIHKV